MWARASWPFNCEDFALFLNEAPGALFYLGVADTETGINGAPHAPNFAADERAISHGVRATAGLLTDRLAARSVPGSGLGLRSEGAARTQTVAPQQPNRPKTMSGSWPCRSPPSPASGRRRG